MKQILLYFPLKSLNMPFFIAIIKRITMKNNNDKSFIDDVNNYFNVMEDARKAATHHTDNVNYSGYRNI